MNYELGVRYDNGRTRAEVVGFLSDYENILGVCTASSGAGCEIGDAFNGDAATVKGVEVILATELLSRDRYRVPLEITYTWTDGQFDTDIADTDFFGSVSAGDPLPYIPDQQLHATAGLENSHWSTWLSATYVDEVCVRASCGEFERVDSALIWDLSGEYRFNEAWSLFARIENLTSENDIMGRHPYGARPNRDRTAALGFKVAF